MTNKITTESKKETWELAKKLAKQLKSRGINIILLQGELGTGKTTFAQGLLKSMKAKGPFTSPTFVIMKEYNLSVKSKSIKNNFKKIYHLDCYRVKAQDILELGWEEIRQDKNNLILVEWPERIKGIWPKKYLLLKFKLLEKNKRKISIIENGKYEKYRREI